MCPNVGNNGIIVGNDNIVTTNPIDEVINIVSNLSKDSNLNFAVGEAIQ